MRWLWFCWLCAWLGACGSEQAPPRSEAAPDSAAKLVGSTSRVDPDPPAHRQVLLVLTSGWDEAAGELSRWRWEQGQWQPVGTPIPVLIGRNGLGWGIGLRDYRALAGPSKQEGDLKSPAGVFALGTAFGYAPAEAVDFLQVPYTHVSRTLMCIEDTASRAYNRIVDETKIQADWSSTDHMRRDDDLYQWGMLVQHNYDPALPGQGSCIFLHGWRAGGRGTAGCTSMDKERLRDVLAWLDPAMSPVLVQAPRPVYADWDSGEDLPPLPQAMSSE